MGKNVGDDLAEGKPTLPLIRAMQVGSPAQASLVRGAIEKGGLEQLDEVLEVVRLTGGLDYTRSRAQEMADNALSELKALPESEFRDSLERIALLSVGRQA
jgi:octaprenyl-diphosphate synthase